MRSMERPWPVDHMVEPRADDEHAQDPQLGDAVARTCFIAGSNSR